MAQNLSLHPSRVSGVSSVQGCDRDDGTGRWVATEGAGERLAGEVEDAAVFGDHEVAVTEPDHPRDRLVQMTAAHGTLEGGVEGEDPSIGAHEPVARAVAVRDEGLDRGIEVPAAHRSIEVGVSEGEDSTVGGHHVVPLSAGCRDGAEHWAIARRR